MCCLLLVVRSVCFVVCYALIVCWSFGGFVWLMFVGGCALFRVSRLLLFVVLFAACCSLFVVVCSLFD